ncbi:MAG: hypothetical protein AAFQ94_05500 [Bacteroidota bacterium]
MIRQHPEMNALLNVIGEKMSIERILGEKKAQKNPIVGSGRIITIRSF